MSKSQYALLHDPHYLKAVLDPGRSVPYEWTTNTIPPPSKRRPRSSYNHSTSGSDNILLPISSSLLFKSYVNFRHRARSQSFPEPVETRETGKQQRP
jgi:hypothetical protein